MLDIPISILKIVQLIQREPGILEFWTKKEIDYNKVSEGTVTSRSDWVITGLKWGIYLMLNIYKLLMMESNWREFVG